MPICPKKICSPEYSHPLPHTGLVALWTASLHAESQSAILAPFGNLSTPRGALFLKGKPLISVSIRYIWLISFGNLSIREDIIDGLWIRDHCPSSWKKDLTIKTPKRDRRWLVVEPEMTFAWCQVIPNQKQCIAMFEIHILLLSCVGKSICNLDTADMGPSFCCSVESIAACSHPSLQPSFHLEKGNFSAGYLDFGTCGQESSCRSGEMPTWVKYSVINIIAENILSLLNHQTISNKLLLTRRSW